MMENLAYNKMRTPDTLRLFGKMMTSGWWHRLWARFLRHPVRLLELEETVCCSTIENSHYGGVKSVKISQIRGTQGKADAFDDGFHPLDETTKSRWLSVAKEKLRGHDLPPVELLDVDGTYYVRDGHHRISVASSLGEKFIDAEITIVSMSHPWM